ncbi:hypothetical protein H2198_007408 [Neophaeococcomyces mojaviensis]|uniref:Uncharacterized protein n=1 Tax=Neophaeococcomyces mojaviensis TaxID=3383035 RepID=A0ACC3A0S0_9EURO|nr:hypothetical protein H2198_007408 [Knufia sp. JES_112]
MYGERNGENSHEDFQELHAKVIDYIPEIYVDILEFSYAMRKYTDKHTVIRIGKNIFKDVRSDFEAIIQKIKQSDERMRDYAKTASERMMNHLQKKSLKNQDEMRSEIASLKGILETSLKANEAVVRQAFEGFEEEKRNMRKKTPYEKAQDEFEENMAYLDPTPDHMNCSERISTLNVSQERVSGYWKMTSTRNGMDLVVVQ